MERPGTIGEVKNDTRVGHGAPFLPASAGRNGFTAFEEWLTAHLDGIVLALIAALFLYQANRAATVHLNPDEALFYHLAHQLSILKAYAVSTTNAHPPLMIVFLQSWIKLNSSEIFLRLPSILAYCVFLWFLYRWALLALGPAAGLAAAVIAAFVPPIFNLAVEVRPYTILLCSMSGAMWTMERAFYEKSFPDQSLKWTGTGIAFLYLAILSHYSALYFVSAFGVYCLIRIWQGALSAAAVKLWIAGQIVGVGIYAILYVTHISHLHNSGLEQEAQQGWLRPFYWQRGDDAIQYLIVNTRGLLEYLFGSPWAGVIAGVLVLAALALLLRRNRELLAVTLLPWILYAAAALRGLYPYGGTRHGVFLTFSLVIACSVTLAAAAQKKLWILSALLVLLVPVWRSTAIPDGQFLPDERQKREFMVDAVNYLRTSVPPGGLVFADYESSLLLCYYYDPTKFCFNDSGEHFWRSELGGIRLVTSKIWSLDPARFVQELAILKAQYDVKPGAALWSFQGGWDFPVYRRLRYGRDPLPGVRGFGENIGVFRIPN